MAACFCLPWVQGCNLRPNHCTDERLTCGRVGAHTLSRIMLLSGGCGCRASMLSSTVAPPCLHTKKAMKTTSPRLYFVVGADCSLHRRFPCNQQLQMVLAGT
jgi:hypothetical protein